MNLWCSSALVHPQHFSVLFRAVLLVAVCAWMSGAAIAQTAQSQRTEDLRGVLSRQVLNPPLRSASIAVRYSSDGTYLMVQDPVGIYIFSREPLTLRGYFSAQDSYPAQFSFDSKTLVSIGNGLTMTRAKLPLGEKLEEKELPIHDSCLQGLLSPGGEFFACLGPDFRLTAYQLSTDRAVFSQILEQKSTPYPIVFIPLGEESAFSTPFGFRLSNDWDAMVNRGMTYASLFFSADGRTLFANGPLDAFRIDLTSGQKSALPSAVKKHKLATFSILKDDLLLVAGGEKEMSAPEILSLRNGHEVAAPSFKADAIHLATNPRYALLADDGKTGLRIFDLDQNREWEAPPNLGLDVFGDEVAAVDEHGYLFVYKLGQRLPIRASDLPLDHLPLLRAAAATPDLDKLAFSVVGSGAVFSLTTGQRLYSALHFSSANFSSPSSADLLVPASLSAASHAIHVDLGSTLVMTNSRTTWSGGKDLLRSGGAVLLEYAFASPMGHGLPVVRMHEAENDIPYQLRGLDPATGKELWKLDFSENFPIPFADPQGDRFVLAWNAKAEGAESAAKRIPSAWEVYKHAKVTKLDTFFEVMDARSAKPVGGVLVQQGSGPFSYESAFSVADALFLVKDGKRVSEYSLSSGNRLAQLVGGMPSASSQNGLFAIEEGQGRLCIHGLATAAKLDEHPFRDAIDYTRFSADGKRLLVMTTHQVAYILDVSTIRPTPQPPPTPNPN
jgi:hypothetical protein